MEGKVFHAALHPLDCRMPSLSPSGGAPIPSPRPLGRQRGSWQFGITRGQIQHSLRLQLKLANTLRVRPADSARKSIRLIPPRYSFFSQ